MAQAGLQENELLDAVGELGIGCIAFSPLAQGMLTDKYLEGIPTASRAARESSLSPALITEETLAKVRGLSEIASRRGQSLAQMAIAWVLRDPRVTSALVGASSVAHVEANVAALDTPEFSADELTEIDRKLEKSHPGRFGSRALVGCSMGAYQALYLAAHEKQQAPEMQRFDRYVAINTPVDLHHGINCLDRFHDAPLRLCVGRPCYFAAGEAQPGARTFGPRLRLRIDFCRCRRRARKRRPARCALA